MSVYVGRVFGFMRKGFYFRRILYSVFKEKMLCGFIGYLIFFRMGGVLVVGFSDCFYLGERRMLRLN